MHDIAPRLRRLLAAALAFSFLGTQCLFAYQPENNFWSERRKATQKKSSLLVAALPVGRGVPDSLAAQFPAIQNLNPVVPQTLARSVPKGFLKDHVKLLSVLSTAHGTLRKVSLGHHYSPSGPVVLHIQDVHMNSEAQWNIRETVRSLMGSGQVNLVALEGATEDIQLQPFVDYPHRKPVELAADYLLKENKISGPIHAALTAQGQLPRFLGIDDAVHYQANIQAYRDSAPKLETTRQEVKSLQAEIDAQKGRDFSPALRSFDQQVEGYRKGQVSLGDYVQILVGPKVSLPSKSIRTFLQALQMERTLDFRQVESERARLVEQLMGKLAPNEIQSLVSQTVAHRSGELGYADFYTHLKNLCQGKRIHLSDYPAMDVYVRYVLLAEEINAESLLEELAALEKSAYARLAVTPEEKALVQRSRQTNLMEKLVDFSLTPHEWRDYQSTGPHEGGLDLSSFESFYQEAQARDDAMSKNVMGALSSGPSSSVTVLVTGGFHAERMADQLTRQGVTVLSYVPKINKIDTAQGSTYLSVFTQEKTPLERLFQGEKLFLAQNPFSELAQQYLSLCLSAQAFRAGKGKISNEERNDLNKLKGDPHRAVEHLLFDKEVLYLEIRNKKIPIIDEAGNLFLNFDNFLPVQEAPVKSGGILWFLGGKNHPERAWWIESLAFVFSGIVLVLVGQGLTQFGVDLSSWGGSFSPIGLAMGGDVPSLLWVLGGLFIGAHVIEYVYYRLFKMDLFPPLKNSVYSVLIAFPLFLVPFLDFSSLNSLLVAIVIKPLWHKNVNEWKSGHSDTIVSQPNPTTLNPWRVLVGDPMREQLTWFVGIIVGGHYFLASNSVLFVGGGFPLFFLALSVFGVLLTKIFVPIFLAWEHESYSEEERKALLPIAEKISYWTLGAFILTYFALCPWGLNGIAETGQFFSFISSPDAKTFVFSAIAGYFVGLVKHMMHNYRTFSALEGRNSLFPSQRTLLPLSRTGGRKKPNPVPSFSRVELKLPEGVTRGQMLSDYYKWALLNLETEEILDDNIRILALNLQRHNPIFFNSNQELLGDTNRLRKDPTLVRQIVNSAIFLPLHAHALGFRSGLSAGIDIDQKSWRGYHYLGEKLWMVNAKQGTSFGMLNVDHGVGLIPVVDYYENGKNIVESGRRNREMTLTPAETANLAQWGILMGKATEERNTEIILQMLKDNAFARLVSIPGEYNPAPTLDQVSRSIIRQDDNFLWKKYQQGAAIHANARLSGLIRGLTYLKEKNQCYLGMVLFNYEMTKFLVEGKESGSDSSSALREVFLDIGRHLGPVAELQKKHEDQKALEATVVLLTTTQDKHFYPFAERYFQVKMKNPGTYELGHSPLSSAPAKDLTVIPLGKPVGDPPPNTMRLPVNPVAKSSAFFPSNSEKSNPLQNGLSPFEQAKQDKNYLTALSILVETFFEAGSGDSLVSLGKDVLPFALQQAWERTQGLLSVGDNLDSYLSLLQTTIQEFKRLSRESPLGKEIYNEEAQIQWEAMIEVLQAKMMETIRISYPAILPVKLHEFSESLGFSDDEKQFLYQYNYKWKPGAAVLVSDVRWGDKSDLDISKIHDSIWGKLGDADALPLKRDVLEEIPNDVISFGENGELTLNGYEVVFPDTYSPRGYQDGFSKNSKIERAIFVALQIVSRHPNDIFDTRSGMEGLGVHKKHTLGHTVFIKFVGSKAFVLWVGPVNRSHGVGSSANSVVDAEVTARAKDINSGNEESIPLQLRHFRPNGSKNGKGLNSFVFATPEMVRPMLVLFPILIFLSLLNSPISGVFVAVIIVVGLDRIWSGGALPGFTESVKKNYLALLRRVRSIPIPARSIGKDKTSSMNLAKELAEVMAFADNRNSHAASERVIALLNGTSTRLNVESIVGPQGLGALAAVTDSFVFRDSDFQNQFPLEMERIFPMGFPLGRARRAVGGLALDGTTQVGPGGLAADVDMKTKKGLVAILTREMLKDLPKRVGSFEKAAQGKPVYWVAEDALVFQALQKIRPFANVMIRPRLVEREGAFVVVSGKTLERVVSSNRFLQDFAIALPKGTQVDMEGVDAASVLRNAVFFFLDELLSGMKVDFNTLRTIDTVARLIASAA